MTTVHFGSRGWNRNCFLANNGDTYAVGIDNSFDGVINRITPAGVVTSQKLSLISGNPLNYPMQDTTDEHLVPSIGQDPDGFVHMTGGFHNIMLKMVKQSTLNQVANWTVENTDSAFSQTSVYCFPGFEYLNDGTLLFTIFRSDDSNNTMKIAQYKKAAGQPWVKLNDIAAGTNRTTSYGPFFSQPFVDTRNWIHLFFAWHHNIANPFDQPGPVMYCVSKDGGNSWQTINGTALTLPLTEATSSGCSTGQSPDPSYNPTGAVNVDANGYPQCQTATLGGGNWIVHWNGTAWETITPPSLAIIGGMDLVLFQGYTWELAQRAATVADPNRLILVRTDQNGGPRMSGGYDIEANWFPRCDIRYLRSTGTIRTYVPYEDGSPRFYYYGNGARRIHA